MAVLLRDNCEHCMNGFPKGRNQLLLMFLALACGEHLILSSHIFSPPRHAPMARAQTNGRKDRHKSGDWAKFQTTGMVAVVKGMLSMKEDAMADTHKMRTMAVNIWCSGGTFYSRTHTHTHTDEQTG